MRKKHVPITPELEAAYEDYRVAAQSPADVPSRCPHCGSALVLQTQARNIRLGGHGTPSAWLCLQRTGYCPFTLVVAFMDAPPSDA